MAYIIVPKYLDNTRKPEYVSSEVGRNYHLGPQLAGRRVLRIQPRPGEPFNPAKHLVDLGPNDPNQPQVFLPGFGHADLEELKDLMLALNEKNQERDWFTEQREKRPDINARVRDYADRLLRQARGRKTFGPGS